MITTHWNTEIVTIGYNRTNSTLDKSTVNEPIFHPAQVITCIIQLSIAVMGNSISVAVLLRKAFRRTSTSVFLIGLAISDTTYLSITVGYYTMYWHSYTPFLAHSEAGCKIFTFLPYFSAHLSSWMLVNITIERFVAVTFPFKAKLLYSPKRAIFGTLVTVCLIFMLNIHYLVKYGIIKDDYGVPSCYTDISPSTGQIVVWLDSLLFSIVPITMIFILNVIIFIKLRRSHQFKTQKSSAISRDQMDAFRTILLVTTTFIVLTLPVSVTNIYYGLRKEDQYDDLADTVFNVTHAIMNNNFCLNFFIYCLTGRKFRKELWAMCCCSSKSKMSATQTDKTKTRPNCDETSRL